MPPILDLLLVMTVSDTAKRSNPSALAAEYCLIFVRIHAFQDVSSRMCRLLWNAVLIKYTGVAVSLGEHNQERHEYTGTADLIARRGRFP